MHFIFCNSFQIVVWETYISAPQTTILGQNETFDEHFRITFHNLLVILKVKLLVPEYFSTFQNLRLGSIKFQSLVAPNGLILDLYGPGPLQGATQIRPCSLGLAWRRGYTKFLGVWGIPSLCMLTLHAWLETEHDAQRRKRSCSAMMSGVRIAVEWAYGQIRHDFPFLKTGHERKGVLVPRGHCGVIYGNPNNRTSTEAKL